MSEEEKIITEIKKKIASLPEASQRIVMDHAVVARRIAETPEGIIALALVSAEIAFSPDSIDEKSGMLRRTDSEHYSI